jgi:Flp pilus assembly protein TadG
MKYRLFYPRRNQDGEAATVLTGHINRLIRRWRAETRGNIAIIFALSVIPILSIVGVAIDTQMTMTQKNKVQAVIDNAVIYGSRSMQGGKSRADVTKDVNTYVAALLKQQDGNLTCTGVAMEYVEGKQDINATILCSQPTTLSNLFGQTKMDFRVRSGSTYGIGKLEVAFVFDVSGSMGNKGKMSDLKVAARDAVDTLMPADSNLANPDDVRIAMTTYDTMVNAGSYFKAVTGKNKSRTESVTTTVREKVCVSYYWWGGCRTYEWQDVDYTDSVSVNNSCVQERRGAQAFTDAAPGNNAWLESGSAAYDRYGRLQAISCNSIGPLPLTNNKNSLTGYINSLDDYGSTAGHMGVAWGWYLLAPTWSSVWPLASRPMPYDEPDAAKAMIMMTDGEFNEAFAPGQGSSFDQAKKQCDAVKEKGIMIYTVAFQAPKAGKDILEYCASSADFAFTPDNGQELKDAYKMIAQSISDLRITY